MPDPVNDLSVCSRIMLEMESELKKLVFRQVRNEAVSEIVPDNIRIAKCPDKMPQEGELAFSQYNLPGILISPPNSIRRPGGEGENDVDEVHYSILVQIIDVNYERDGGLHTHLAWQQKIAKHFARTQLNQRVWDTDGYVYFGHAEELDSIDEKLFNRHHAARCFVVVHFISNEP